MNRSFLVAPLLLAMTMLAGCSTIDRLTGQTDDTVLPGKREDALPGRSQFPVEEPAQPQQAQSSGEPSTATTASAGGEAQEEPACKADDPECIPPATDDTFSDGQ